LEEYLQGIREVAEESYRVLKPGRYAAILIGDTRKRRHYVPIAFRVMQQFLDVGFVLKEDIIKLQWKTKTTREKWVGIYKSSDISWVKEPGDKRRWVDFYLIAHEHLFVFRKPKEGEKFRDLKYSMK
jgi:DNA modification methylase